MGPNGPELNPNASKMDTNGCKMAQLRRGDSPGGAVWSMTLLIIKFLTFARTNFKLARGLRRGPLGPDVFVVRFYVGVKNGPASKGCSPSHEPFYIESCKNSYLKSVRNDSYVKALH